MEKAKDAANLERLTILLSILSILANSEEYDFITSTSTFFAPNNLDTDRINRICAYTLTNYKNAITIAEISALSNLSVTSFCRYFKKMTKKTYYDFLTEIRISHACRILIESEMTVEVICMECGFNNPSNFYRHFKNITGHTPVEYKKKYLNKTKI